MRRGVQDLLFAHICSFENIPMRAVNAMVIDFKSAGEPGTRAEFSYHITPTTISITGKGRLSVGKSLEAVLRRIEYWHQAPIITFSIMAGMAGALGTAFSGMAKRQPLFH
jgi:hypothetical protein